MATLEELRNQLDEIDNRMAELYQMRMDVCQQVGEYKVKAGRKVYDRQSCLLYTSPSPRDVEESRMPSSA